jgi:hypothetical protein
MGYIPNQYPRHVSESVFDVMNVSVKDFAAIGINKILSS